jgi:hypothetical protein
LRYPGRHEENNAGHGENAKRRLPNGRPSRARAERSRVTNSDHRGRGRAAGSALLLGAQRPERDEPARVSGNVPFASRFRAPGRSNNRYRAFIAGGGAPCPLDPCPAAARASFLAIHGTADSVVPYSGKRPEGAGSVPRSAARWALAARRARA